MVCLSDWRLRRLASSARYLSIRRTNGVNFLTGQSVAASGQSAPHVERPFREGGRCRGRLYRRGTFKPAWRPAAWESAVFRGYEALPWRQAWAVMWISWSAIWTTLKLDARPERIRFEMVPAVEMIDRGLPSRWCGRRPGGRARRGSTRYLGRRKRGEPAPYWQAVAAG